MTEPAPEIQGYDVDAVERWLGEHVPELRSPLRWQLLVGGHSNLTCRVDDSVGTRVVIRRPPLGELQPRAHDMAREFTVISALWPTDVPVARPYAVCTDTDVTGAVFYVMGHVEGHTGSTDWLATDDARRTASESFVDTLAALHRLDVDAIGLGELASKEHYLARQLRSWYRSWTTSADAAGFDDPRAHHVHDWLAEHVPPDHTPRLVHGDYGFHNLIVGDDARVAAVVDWEVCTLGDALSDLAYVLNRWSTDDGPPGWLTRDELVTRYQEATGADLSTLDSFVAFNYWRSACIIHGVYTRYVRGQKDATGVDLDAIRAHCEERLAEAEQAVARLST